MIENIHTIKGTLFEKVTRNVPNKKNPTEPDWKFFSIKVETKVLIQGRDITTIPEIQLDRGVGFEEFKKGDLIEVDCYAFGKSISDTWYKTELKAVYIKKVGEVAEQETMFNEKANGNKIEVSSTSSVDDLNNDAVFIAPDPTKAITRPPKEEEDDDLPFILTIPIALGFLSQFLI